MSSYSISYRTNGLDIEWEGPAECAAHALADQLQPVRKAASYKGQKNYPGFFWMSSTNEHLMYESKLEMMILLQLDFNSTVSKVVPQPFKMRYHHDSRVYHHTPDFFVHYKNGAGEVINVKPKKWVNTERNRRAFFECDTLSQEMGFSYSTRSEPDPLLVTNLQWLVGYRRLPPRAQDYFDIILDCASDSMTIGQILKKTLNPAYVRPILFYAIWKQMVVVDIYQQINLGTKLKISKTN